MTKRILFADYENVSSVKLASLPDDVYVPFFFGASQKTVPTDLMRSALKLGERFIPIDIEGQGANALDFHIAFYLGEYLSKDPEAECVILSKDKGFDPLVKHLMVRSFRVRRTSTLAEAFPSYYGMQHPEPAEVTELSPLAAAMRLLRGMQPRARPRKRKSLVAHLHSHFRDKLNQDELNELVDRMILEKLVSETSGALGYHL